MCTNASVYVNVDVDCLNPYSNENRTSQILLELFYPGQIIMEGQILNMRLLPGIIEHSILMNIQSGKIFVQSCDTAIGVKCGHLIQCRISLMFSGVSIIYNIFLRLELTQGKYSHT